MTEPLLTRAARRHARRLLQATAPSADRLDRRFRSLLRGEGQPAAIIQALAGITPVAAAKLGSLRHFLVQVETQSTRLAKLNVEQSQVRELLGRFGPLLDTALEGRFQPAREQLHLATILRLERAYYAVREAETQALFGLYQAGIEGRSLDDLLLRLIRVLTRALHARAGRIVRLERAGGLARPLCILPGKRAERLVADPAMRRYPCCWSYPARNVLMQFGFAAPGRWLPRDLALLEAAGELVDKAVERTRLETEIGRLEADAQHQAEEERRRIGRELHDEAGQSLLLLRLQLEMLERDAPVALRPRLQELRGIAERTVSELRRIVAALSPQVLERLGLASALRQLAGRFRKMHAAEIHLRIAVPPETLSREIQEVIYRVAQESLQNVVKHSDASTVRLSLQVADKSIRLSVADNGAGFDAETICSPVSFGLAGMRQRAALLGGTLALRTGPRKGTTVILQLPRLHAQVIANGKDSCNVDRRSHAVPAGNPDAAVRRSGHGGDR